MFIIPPITIITMMKKSNIFDKYVQVPAQLLECAMHQNNKDIAISTHNLDTHIKILCKGVGVKCGKKFLVEYFFKT